MSVANDNYPRSFYCSAETWSAAKARAAAEGARLTSLIRQFVVDYAAGRDVVGLGKVRLTPGERDAIQDALGGLDIAGIVVDTINKERG